MKAKPLAGLPRDWAVLADVRPGGRGGRGWRFEGPAVEDVFDELCVGVEAEDLVVDVGLLGLRADLDPATRRPSPGAVDDGRDEVGRRYVPVIPRAKDRGALPVRAVDDRFDEPGDLALPGADEGQRGLGDRAVGVYPRHGRQCAFWAAVSKFVGDGMLPRCPSWLRSVNDRMGSACRRLPVLPHGRAGHRGVVLGGGLGALEGYPRRTVARGSGRFGGRALP